MLDQTVETQGDTSNFEIVQEAVAAANAVADMSRRTWTQARQLMKDVHRSRGYFPSGKSKGKGKWRRPGPCLFLCQGPHWALDWQGTQELFTVSTGLPGRRQA